MTDTEGMDRLASGWRSLASSSRSATVFQSYDWNRVWWNHFGRKFGRRLHILTFHDSSDTLVGIAPFYTSYYFCTPLRRLAFIGMGSSDYLDVITHDDYKTAVLEALESTLLSDRAWHIADFQQLREGGAFRSESEYPARARETIGEPAPFINLPATWPDFLATLGKKTRSNIGYYERTLHKLYEVQIGWITDAAQIDDEMTALFELHQRRWNKRWLPGVFGNASTQSFHRDVAKALHEHGHLRLFRIALDGETQASLYCFSFGDRICYYQGGFEPSLSKLSLGTVLTANAIKTAIEEKKPVFDFLRGDEEYKAKWTSLAAHNARRIAVHSVVLAPLTLVVRSLENSVEMNVKRLARKLR